MNRGVRVKVTAIVPAYNEENNISKVLVPLGFAKEQGYVDEVLVVCDGCKDNTAKVAQECGARVLELNPNKGKGGAMLEGAMYTDSDILVFVDADLLGLTPSHIKDLVDPLLSGKAKMSMGLFGHGRFSTDAAQKVAPFLSGQRAIFKEDFLKIPDVATSRYGVEIEITKYSKKNKWLVERVIWDQMSQVMKEEKLGFFGGLKVRLRMYWEIIKASI